MASFARLAQLSWFQHICVRPTLENTPRPCADFPGAAAECLDIADQVLVVDGEGGVTLESNSHSASLRSRLEELGPQLTGATEKAESNPQPGKTKKEMSVSELELLNSRRRQDMSLYRLFINSIGKRLFWPWILVVICVPLGESMTGEYMTRFLFGDFVHLLMIRYRHIYTRLGNKRPEHRALLHWLRWNCISRHSRFCLHIHVCYPTVRLLWYSELNIDLMTDYCIALLLRVQQQACTKSLQIQSCGQSL